MVIVTYEAGAQYYRCTGEHGVKRDEVNVTNGSGRIETGYGSFPQQGLRLLGSA
jgi:hypothetical protein